MEIEIIHIDEFGNIVSPPKQTGKEAEVDVWSLYKSILRPGKIVFMNGTKEASPDLLNMGRVLVEINRRQEINPSDIAILKAYGIKPGPEIEDIHGFCEKVWDWAKENL